MYELSFLLVKAGRSQVVHILKQSFSFQVACPKSAQRHELTVSQCSFLLFPPLLQLLCLNTRNE